MLAHQVQAVLGHRVGNNRIGGGALVQRAGLLTVLETRAADHHPGTAAHGQTFQEPVMPRQILFDVMEGPVFVQPLPGQVIDDLRFAAAFPEVRGTRDFEVILGVAHIVPEPQGLGPPGITNHDRDLMIRGQQLPYQVLPDKPRCSRNQNLHQRCRTSQL